MLKISPSVVPDKFWLDLLAPPLSLRIHLADQSILISHYLIFTSWQKRDASVTFKVFQRGKTIGLPLRTALAHHRLPSPPISLSPPPHSRVPKSMVSAGMWLVLAAGALSGRKLAPCRWTTVPRRDSQCWVSTTLFSLLHLSLCFQIWLILHWIIRVCALAFQQKNTGSLWDHKCISSTKVTFFASCFGFPGLITSASTAKALHSQNKRVSGEWMKGWKAQRQIKDSSLSFSVFDKP